jgi:K+ transporter
MSRIVIRYGFSQSPDVPKALSALKQGFEPMEATYFLSRQTSVSADRCICRLRACQ